MSKPRSSSRARLVGGLSLLALAICAFVVAAAAHGATVTVCSSGCGFTTIQAAIGAASSGDTVSVGPGTYVENVSVNKSNLTVVSTDGASSTTIQATDGNSTPVSFGSGISGSTVDGFTITHVYTSGELAAWTFNNNGVIFQQSAHDNTLKNSVVTLNRNGVYINTSKNNKLVNDQLTNNRTGLNMTGDFTGTEITGSTLSDNWTEGLVIYGTNSPGIDLSTVSLSGDSIGGNWYEQVEIKSPTHTSTSTFTGHLNVSNVTFTDSPVTYSTSGDASLDEPAFADQKPNVAGIGGSAAKPSTAAPTLRIYGTPGAVLEYDHAKTVLVGPGQTIQSGVDAAASGDTVSVPAGTYPEDVTVNKALTLDGAQAGVDARTRSGSESLVKSISISASNVNVDGFSFNGTASQVSVNSTTSILSGLAVKNDIFNGYGSVGLMTFNAGNIAVSQDLFEHAAASSEAMQIKASDPSLHGCTGSTVQNNSFSAATNNGGSDINFSCTGSDSTNVTVSGNASTGMSGGSSLTAFSGVDDGISVTNNTATTDGSSVFFFGNVSGSASITGNTFTSTTANAVSIHGGDVGTTDSPNSGTFTISSNKLSAAASGVAIAAATLTGSAAIHNNDLSGAHVGVTNNSAGSVNATNNWWGSASGPGSLAGVTTSPFCVNSGCTTPAAPPATTTTTDDDDDDERAAGERAVDGAERSGVCAGCVALERHRLCCRRSDGDGDVADRYRRRRWMYR